VNKTGKQPVELTAAKGMLQEGRLYAAAVEGKTTGEDSKVLIRGSLENTGIVTHAIMGNPQSRDEDHAVGEGSSKLSMEGAGILESLRILLISLKKKAERLLGCLEMGEFSNFIFEQGLMDIPLTRGVSHGLELIFFALYGVGGIFFRCISKMATAITIESFSVVGLWRGESR
jgi:hypothetical protein